MVGSERLSADSMADGDIGQTTRFQIRNQGNAGGRLRDG